ncbi:efflux transporter outer membrane subunit [Zavarzinia sp.]|uniref:efflux transporter outer membrane subunit n=1 Tax=Zavarzinia sp. TaxID=2027920 RepID=UPI00356B17FC
MRYAALILLPALALGACSSKPKPPPEVVVAPAAWAAPAGGGAEVWPAADWWQGFGSAELDRLIAEAKAGNADLGQAAARVAQAEAQLRIAGSSLWPSLSLSGGATRRRGSDTGTGSGAADTWRSTYSASLSASYEIDFWGANAADRAAAAASLAASRFDRETVALTVTSGVATTYLQVLSLRDRLDVARRNLAIAEEVLRLVEAKVGAGAASDLDLAQQRTVVAQRRAAIPPLEQNLREQSAALAVLLGTAPTGFEVAGQSLAPVKMPPAAAGLPSALLARRPDIASAEARLVAADANIDAARAAFFPQVTLSASMALTQAAVGDLFDLSNAAYSLGASLLQTIFDGGRVAAQHELAKAQKEELVQSYRGAVLAAFSDAEVTLGAVDSLNRQRLLQDEVLAQARRSLELAQIQYRAGAADLLTVLNAQQSLYSAEDQAAQVKLSALQAYVGLYRALGGGWQAP